MDGFNYCREECNSYFLTHYHSDHTTGLHPAFDLGRIYCSEITKRLLVYDMGVAEKVVVALPMNETTEVEGVAVTPLDANHCPGSVMFFFHDPSSDATALHVGDFRADRCVVENAALHQLLASHGGRLDTLYLDTTYCKPRFTLPRQATAIAALEDIVHLLLRIASGARPIWVEPADPPGR